MFEPLLLPFRGQDFLVGKLFGGINESSHGARINTGEEVLTPGVLGALWRRRQDPLAPVCC